MSRDLPDLEWDALQEAWQTQPVPSFENVNRRIRWSTYRLNGVVALDVLSTLMLLGMAVYFVIRSPGWASIGWAAAMVITIVLFGAYTIKLRRGLWSAQAQDTKGLLELALRRAKAGARYWMVGLIITPFALAFGMYGGFLARQSSSDDVEPSTKSLIILTIILVGWFISMYLLWKRRLREAEELERILDSLKEEEQSELT